MTTFLALLAAVIGFWALRRDRHGARAAADAAAMALVLGGTAAGAWIVTAWRGLCDGTPGALAGTVVGVLITTMVRDRTTGR